ncbi:MAG: helix-turn-helix transcriptional regulator [Oscillospiraceae bacterium]|nr:helix-turn-helix transcriptional regulator [Oscillospiraceae bacterium]
MPLSIGQTIKKLRKERKLTQEELAEQLNVTSQAISKWENETGMPDISQIVPLASVFGVSTDVLFGTFGTSDEEEARKILDDAYGFKIGNTESLRRRYDMLQDGLRRFPNHGWLLMNSIQTGLGLIYPENNHYDKIQGNEIYQECIRQANVLIANSKNTNDILNARYIMVLLHSAYGNKEEAWEHAKQFLWRTDFTAENMYAWIARAETNYTAEAYHLQNDFGCRLTATLDNIIQLGTAYRNMKKYDDALKMYFSVFSLMEIVYGEEKLMPPVQNTDSGDVYVLIAQTYLETGDKDKALDWLEKLADYDTKIRCRLQKGVCVDTPFLRDAKNPVYCITDGENKERLLKKLNEAKFESIENEKRFIALINRANAMDG